MTATKDSWLEIKLAEMESLSKEIGKIHLREIQALGDRIVSRLNLGARLAFLGNGGSAAEAMHFAAEFVSKCTVDHPPISAICLNESQSIITAIANDYGFEYVFERAVKAELRSGDVLIALSTSGRSKNVLNAIESAVEIGVDVLLWTGSTRIENLKGVEVWNCELNSTPRIQEVHLIWGHLLAEYVERKFVPSGD